MLPAVPPPHACHSKLPPSAVRHCSSPGPLSTFKSPPWISPSRILAVVMAPLTILTDVTASAAILLAVTALLSMVSEDQPPPVVMSPLSPSAGRAPPPPPGPSDCTPHL